MSGMEDKVATTTVGAGALSTLPSFTTKVKTYSPAISVVNVGLEEDGDAKVAVELFGLDTRSLVSG